MNPVIVDEPKPTPKADPVWWASLFILCTVLGAMLGLSVKTQNVVRRQSQASEKQGNQFLVNEVLSQQRTITDLRQNLTQINTTIATGSNRAQELDEELKKANLLAGLVDVQGPGLIVTLNDSKNHMPTALPVGMTPPNIIHDTDINQTVNELKAAGAEALAVNGQRLVATSPVRCAGPTIYVNNIPQTPPYIIKVIGDPKTLQDALNLPGGVADQLRQFDPAMIKFQKAGHLVIPAYAGPTQPKYATPVAPSTAEQTAKM